MNITVLYVGSSLLAPLKDAEREINRSYKLDLRVAAYNFGSPLTDRDWQEVDRDLSKANVVFVIHVIDGENAARLIPALELYKDRHNAVIVINCMPELMRRTHMGRLDIGALTGAARSEEEGTREHEDAETRRRQLKGKNTSRQALRLLTSVGSWVGKQAG